MNDAEYRRDADMSEEKPERSVFPIAAKKEWIHDMEEGIKLIAIFASIFGAIFLFLVVCS